MTHLTLRLQQEAAGSNEAPQQTCGGQPDESDQDASNQDESDQEVEDTIRFDADDFGLFDYLDLVDDYFGKLNAITGRIASSIESVGDKIKHRSVELNTANASGNRRDARWALDAAAADMMQFVAQQEEELPLFRETLKNGVKAAAQAALISATIDSSGTGPASEARKTLVAFRDSLSGAEDAIEGFRGNVQALPRMTASLIAAKRRTVSVLQELLDSMAAGRGIVTDALKSMDVGIEKPMPSIDPQSDWHGTKFSINDMAEDGREWKDEPGVYIFANRRPDEKSWFALYVGVCESFKARLRPSHEQWGKEAVLGATRVHTKVVEDEASRMALEKFLIENTHPALNRQRPR